jgi:L-2,4-diaminobutyric acid acetyltransferase
MKKRSSHTSSTARKRTSGAPLAVEDPASDTTIRLRTARQADGSQMWRLALNSGVLEENSEYVYHMFCRFFPDSCVVAEVEDQVVGFVAGLTSPRLPDTVFVWQIAVDHEFRGHRIAGRMLAQLMLSTPAEIQYLEATVTPDNNSSRRAFEGFARRHDAEYERSVLFPADLFIGPCDKDEVLFRIGPVDCTRASLRAAAAGITATDRELIGVPS